MRGRSALTRTESPLPQGAALLETPPETTMKDLVFLGLIIGFFLLSLGLVALADRLMESRS